MERMDACRNTFKTTRLIFNVCIEELEEKLKDTDKPARFKEFEEVEMVHSFDKVFIVHRHDGEPKQQVARLLEKQGIKRL